MKVFFWCGVGIVVGIFLLVFGSPSDKFYGVLAILISVITVSPFVVGVAIGKSGSDIGSRVIRLAGYLGAGYLAFFFGLCLLIFVFIFVFLAWQQATKGNYAVAIVVAVVFGAVGLGIWIWARSSRTKRGPPPSPALPPLDPNFTVYPPSNDTLTAGPSGSFLGSWRADGHTYRWVG